MSVYEVNNYRANQTNISWTGGQPTSNTLQSEDPLEFTGYTIVNSAGGNKRNVTFEAPKVDMNSAVSIRNDENNSITYNNSIVNFDDATWNANATFVGRMFFTGTSSLNITANSKGKTLIQASTLAGTITLDVEDGVQDGDTFLVQATDNQLVITDGEWTATPSTVGNITTYTLAKVAPVYKTRLIYEHLTDIPLNFTEVEYLESSGTQYIDTGYKPTNDTGIQIRHTICADNGNDNIIFGCRQDSADTRFWEDLDWGNDESIGWGYGVYSNQDPTYSTYRYKLISSDIGKTVVSRLNYLNSRNCSINDNIRNLPQATLPTITRPIYIFAGNNQGNAGYFTNFKVYEVQISEGTTIVRDFVPCLDNNNVPCMYDKVEGKAYYNLGTGSFTYGRKIIPVEYIESNETQYIDTGFALTANSTLDFTFSPNEQSTLTLWVCGSYTTNTKLTGLRITSSTSLQGYIDNTSSITVSGSNAGNKYHCVMSGTAWEVNGTSGSSTTAVAAKNNLTIFGWNSSANTSSATISGRCSAKLYGFKISDNGSLVRDFIPCKDENNVGFLFDKLSHTAYLKVGTDNFTVGKVMPKKKLRLIRESKRRLPKGFREVEYLESSGTQYIDTGVFPTQLTEVEYRCAVTGSVSNNDSHLFCSRLSASSEAFDLAYMNTPANGLEKFRFIHGTTTTQETTTSVTAIQIANPHTYYMSGTSFKVDGSEKMSFTTTAFTGSYSLWLFGVNSAGSLHNQVRAQRVYKCTIWDNGTLVRDFIPCLDSNNVPCMWDAVERKAYYNAGTGSFTYGHTITPVEYLQSSGTQYIDTGYIASNTSGFSVKIMPLQSNDKYFIGSRPRTATNDRWLAGSNVGPQVYIGWNTNNFVNWELNKVHTVQNNFMNSRTKVLDGTVVAQISETLSSQGSRTAYLFSANDSNATALDTCRIYGTQISDGSSLVRDYIPVKDENNVGYMLDKVSHTLYSNAGTGAFVVGGEYKDIVRFLKGE